MSILISFQMSSCKNAAFRFTFLCFSGEYNFLFPISCLARSWFIQGIVKELTYFVAIQWHIALLPQDLWKQSYTWQGRRCRYKSKQRCPLLLKVTVGGWLTVNWVRSNLVTRSLSGGVGYSVWPSLRWGTHPLSETAHFVNSSTAGDAYKSPHRICNDRLSLTVVNRIPILKTDHYYEWVDSIILYCDVEVDVSPIMHVHLPIWEIEWQAKGKRSKDMKYEPGPCAFSAPWITWL